MRAARARRHARPRGLALALLDGRADPPVPGPEIVESSFRGGRDGLAATVMWGPPPMRAVLERLVAEPAQPA